MSLMLPSTPARQVKSVRTAFKLINRVQTLGGATPSQLTDELDLSKSSIHNYLATLEMDGYVVNDGGTYRLGFRFLTHGMGAKNTLATRLSIAEMLESVADTIDQTAWWMTEEFGRGYFIERAMVGDSPKYGSIGKRSYLHTNALGKAVLECLDDEHVEQIIDRYGLPEQTKRTTTDPDALYEKLETIHDRGFAVSESEAVLGILSVGVGFRDADGRPHAIGVFGHSRNFTGNTAEDLGRRLHEEVSELERQLRNEGM